MTARTPTSHAIEDTTQPDQARQARMIPAGSAVMSMVVRVAGIVPTRQAGSGHSTCPCSPTRGSRSPDWTRAPIGLQLQNACSSGSKAELRPQPALHMVPCPIVMNTVASQSSIQRIKQIAAANQSNIWIMHDRSD